MNLTALSAANLWWTVSTGGGMLGALLGTTLILMESQVYKAWIHRWMSRQMVVCKGSENFGDFNGDYLKSSHTMHPKLTNILQSFSLTQVVLMSTHAATNGTATLIDLAPLPEPSQLLDCSVIPPLGTSDHNEVSLNLKWKPSSQGVRTHKRPIWRYNNSWKLWLIVSPREPYPACETNHG